MTDKPTVPEPAARRWYLGSMNDALFIIDKPPRPSTDDVWFDNAHGPDLVLNVVALTEAQARAIVDAHNAVIAAWNKRASASTPAPIDVQKVARCIRDKVRPLLRRLELDDIAVHRAIADELTRVLNERRDV